MQDHCTNMDVCEEFDQYFRPSNIPFSLLPKQPPSDSRKRKSSDRSLQTYRSSAEMPSSTKKKKRKGGAHRFRMDEIALMEAYYQTGDYWPSRPMREWFATIFGVNQRTVQIWFQNQRAKLKVTKKNQYNSTARNYMNVNYSPPRIPDAPDLLRSEEKPMGPTTTSTTSKVFSYPFGNPFRDTFDLLPEQKASTSSFLTNLGTDSKHTLTPFLACAVDIDDDEKANLIILPGHPGAYRLVPVKSTHEAAFDVNFSTLLTEHNTLAKVSRSDYKMKGVSQLGSKFVPQNKNNPRNPIVNPILPAKKFLMQVKYKTHSRRSSKTSSTGEHVSKSRHSSRHHQRRRFTETSLKKPYNRKKNPLIKTNIRKSRPQQPSPSLPSLPMLESPPLNDVRQQSSSRNANVPKFPPSPPTTRATSKRRAEKNQKLLSSNVSPPKTDRDLSDSGRSLPKRTRKQTPMRVNWGTTEYSLPAPPSSNAKDIEKALKTVAQMKYTRKYEP